MYNTTITISIQLPNIAQDYRSHSSKLSWYPVPQILTRKTTMTVLWNNSFISEHCFQCLDTFKMIDSNGLGKQMLICTKERMLPVLDD